MTELAEGARLEIVCALTGTEGSNPSLSASVIHKTYPLRLYLAAFVPGGSIAV
jgi:hypothetical protein